MTGSVPTPTPPVARRRTTRSHGMPPEFLESTEVVVDSTVTRAWGGEASTARDSGAGLVRPALFREKYVIEEEVGRGGMGRVLVAFDRDLKRRVAMKVLETTEDNREILRRFVEEAQISGQLEHPNLLPVHDVGITEEGDYFFTMKLVGTHETLREVIDRLRAGDPETHEEYPFERRVELIQHLCGALELAHSRGVIHRGVKPENVMVDDLGEVYLLDWGIARLRHELEERAKDKALPTGDTTGSGTSYLIGTPAYMAPEAVEGQTLDGRADLYALAAVLYELLTLHHYLEDAVPGVVAKPPTPPPAPQAPADVYEAETIATPPAHPAGGGKLAKVLRAVLTHEPRDAESYFNARNGRPPRTLSRVLRRGLAKDPAERHATARELEGELRSWQMGCGPIVCPGTALQRGASDYKRSIDRHPLLIPLLTYTLGGAFLISWVVMLVLLLQRG